VLIQNVRVTVGTELGGISPYRIKLLNEGQVLSKNATVRESGLEDGSVLTTIVLPPVYGALAHAGISAPDEVISAKMELHDALSQAGKLKPASHSATYIKLVVQRLTGEEITVQSELDVLIQNVRVTVGTELGGISPYRIKLLNEGQVLSKNATVRESGLEDGSVLTTIVLPPVYGALAHAGISAPDEVISAKMELHDALSQAGKLKPVQTVHPPA